MGSNDTNGIRYRKDESASSFLLNDPSLFSATSYKVLKNQGTAHFVPCVKSLYNGCVKLTYFTGDFTPLSAFLGSADATSVVMLLSNLVESICEIKRNGFLQIRNIILNADMIFVRSGAGAGQLGLMYIPVTIPLSGANDLEACQALFQLCSGIGSRLRLSAPALVAACGSPGFEAGDLDYLLECVRAASAALTPGVPGFQAAPAAAHSAVSQAPSQSPDSVPLGTDSRGLDATGSISPVGGGGVPHVAQAFVIRQVGRPNAPALRVSKPETLMGKSPDKADFAVSSSTAVSRVHCLLRLRPDGSLCVSDRNSTNGTFVNGRRLTPGEEAQLSDGSRLRLADVEFVVAREG